MNDAGYCVSRAFACKRRGVEACFVSEAPHPEPDHSLIRGLRYARIWVDASKSGEPLKELAGRVGQSERYIRRIPPLISLSPNLQAAILDGTQSAHPSLETLARGTIPYHWSRQEQPYNDTP